jgi:hypothetical protein
MILKKELLDIIQAETKIMNRQLIEKDLIMCLYIKKEIR